MLFGFILLDPTQRVPLGTKLIKLSYDLPFIFRNSIQPEEAVIVYLDQSSEERLHQWSNRPWDRSLHAELLERLKLDHARAVVFDILFTEPGPDPAVDRRFAQAMRSFGNVVLGEDLVPFDQAEVYGWRLSEPLDLFLHAAANAGLVSQNIEADNSIRRHFRGFSTNDPPSLSWAAAESLGAPVTKKPANRFIRRWINYYGPPGSIRNYSFSQVILNDFAPGSFRDKVVFIGARQTAGFTGSGKDEFRSPFALRSDLKTLSYPGVEVHATEFLNLIRRDWLIRPPPAVELLLILATGFGFGFGLVLLEPRAASLFAALATGAIITSAYFLFIFEHVWFAWAIIPMQSGIALSWSIGYNWYQLHLQKKLLEQSLALHLAPKRIKQIVRRPELLKPGAYKQLLSIMFTDIANFTTISEGMDSDDLARVMNEYFETTISSIHKMDGTVVKLIGDAIFAFWNAPENQPSHRTLACRAALALRDQVVQFAGKRGALDLRTRIGLHTGLANVGNFGSVSRIDYTALGENINLASRMEGLNKHLGTDILITRETQEGTSEQIVTRFAGHFRLKGFGRVVEVHELVGLSAQAGATKSWRETFQIALGDFQRGSFDEAERGFHCTIEKHPGDGPSRFYLHQIAELRVHPPQPAWAGEVELKEK